MPKIFACRSLAAMEGLKCKFEPEPWALEMLGGRKSLLEHVDHSMQVGVSTGAFSDDGRILYVGGIVNRRSWQGMEMEAEVWSIPCVGWREHLRFAWIHANTIKRLQTARRIPRIVAHVLFGDAYGSNSTGGVLFLKKLGFQFEGVCQNWWLGQDAYQMARTEKFQARSDLN